MHFDVRVHKDDYVGTFWDEEHRSRFLLQPEIEWPLSIDPSVWPSVFFSKIFRNATKLPYGNIEVDPATDDGKYWLNLEEMRAYYDTHKRPGPHGIFVAIHLFSERSLAEDMVPYLLPGGIQAGLTLDHTVPTESPTGSKLLGYDVADASWISGLTNCGYAANEKPQLSRVWQSSGSAETKVASEMSSWCLPDTPRERSRSQELGITLPCKEISEWFRLNWWTRFPKTVGGSSSFTQHLRRLTPNLRRGRQVADFDGQPTTLWGGSTKPRCRTRVRRGQSNSTATRASTHLNEGLRTQTQGVGHFLDQVRHPSRSATSD
jgi:hypothetical protein